jgi:hypothetical protein
MHHRKMQNVRFVHAQPDSLRQKRKQSERACDTCRKRKVSLDFVLISDEVIEKLYRDVANMEAMAIEAQLKR